MHLLMIMSESGIFNNLLNFIGESLNSTVLSRPDSPVVNPNFCLVVTQVPLKCCADSESYFKYEFLYKILTYLRFLSPSLLQ